MLRWLATLAEREFKGEQRRALTSGIYGNLDGERGRANGREVAKQNAKDLAMLCVSWLGESGDETAVEATLAAVKSSGAAVLEIGWCPRELEMSTTSVMMH